MPTLVETTKREYLEWAEEYSAKYGSIDAMEAWLAGAASVSSKPSATTEDGPTEQGYFPDMPAGFMAFGKNLVQVSNITQITFTSEDSFRIWYISGEFLNVTGVSILVVADLLAKTRRGFPVGR